MKKILIFLILASFALPSLGLACCDCRQAPQSGDSLEIAATQVGCCPALDSKTPPCEVQALEKFVPEKIQTFTALLTASEKADAGLLERPKDFSDLPAPFASPPPPLTFQVLRL